MAKRATKTTTKRRACHYIVRLDTFEGRDTACYLLGADPMWIVVSVSDAGASVNDWGYRSLEEVQTAWPEAVAPTGGNRRASPDRFDLRPLFTEPWFQKAWARAKRELASAP